MIKTTNNNKIINIILLITVFLSCISINASFATTTDNQCDTPVATVNSMQGTLLANRYDKEHWEVLVTGNTICVGDTIQTGENSRTVIVLHDHTTIRIGRNTLLKIPVETSRDNSVIEFLKGIGFFFSREPRSLKVKTPIVNAAVEGTEFVVSVSQNEVILNVYEGTVLATNDSGKSIVTSGEQIKTIVNKRPLKVEEKDHRKLVDWAIYYPPVIPAHSDRDLHKASLMLSYGNIDQALSIIETINSSESEALLSVIEITNNNIERAHKLASSSISKSPDSYTGYIALSFVWQAKKNIFKALENAEIAVRKSENNLITLSRLAELQLSVGQIDQAVETLDKATLLNPEYSSINTLKGFLSLLSYDKDSAKKYFQSAITRNEIDPLPHLGLGIYFIRNNELKKGRREIEIAVSLDPNNSILRSYLGKSYYEEKRDNLAIEQYKLAKKYDRLDPTPYFYESVLHLFNNDPVDALSNINKSIENNNHRAVYRSSLQLDQDAAARNIGMAKVYLELGLDQLAVNESIKSLATDPTNHTAHQVLAEIYNNRQRHETAQTSEVLQSHMLQPVNASFLQPLFSTRNLNTQFFFNNRYFSSSDLSNLFSRNGNYLTIDAFTGSNNTVGEQVSYSHLVDNTVFKLSHVYYSDEGFRENNDTQHTVNNLFLQTTPSRRISLQFEYLDRETDKGDIDMIFDGSFNEEIRTNIKDTSRRLGLRYTPSIHNTILASHIQSKTTDFQSDPTVIVPGAVINNIIIDEDANSNSSEITHLYNNQQFNLISGIRTIDVEFLRLGFQRLDTLPSTGATTTIINDILDSEHTTYYSYLNYSHNANGNIKFGLTYDDFESRTLDTSRYNPKIGYEYNFNKDTNLRLSSFKYFKKSILTGKTLEPTHFNGFNQFFEDLQASKIEQHGISFDSAISKDLFVGAHSYFRKIDKPFVIDDKTDFNEIEETNYNTYLNWIISKQFNISFNANYELFTNNGPDIQVYPLKIETTNYPIRIYYRNLSGFSTKLTYHNVRQEYTDLSGPHDKESFGIFDLDLVYNFPERRGAFSLSGRNIFNKAFNFHNLNYTNENNEPVFIPDITILANYKLIF